MEYSEQILHDFQLQVWRYFEQHSRSMPWRTPESNGNFDPYKIMVSELMLQQTQVARVIVKYQQFIAAFPTVVHLAEAELGSVLAQWSGLGYNRRAKFLWLAAQRIVARHGGRVPADPLVLQELPGIGPNTAAAIAAYAYNQRHVFVETNVRTVFIHHFFPEVEAVEDKTLLPLIAMTLPTQDSPYGPRQWYWALMDYGSYLKKAVGNKSRQSRHYTKQSTFNGSKRQIRGTILRLLIQEDYSLASLKNVIEDSRLEAVLAELEAEGMVRRNGQLYSL